MSVAEVIKLLKSEIKILLRYYPLPNGSQLEDHRS